MDDLKTDGTITKAGGISPGIDSDRLLDLLLRVRSGDFSVRMPAESGTAGEIAAALNDIISLNDAITRELKRLSREVGREGRINRRAKLSRARGGWAQKIAAVNALVTDLVQPTVDAARVIGAVAKGDLKQRMSLKVQRRPLKGEFLRTAKTVNTMVDQLGSFASEVTRVAREVGTEGKLGGQAQVKGVAGTWKDLTDNVNSMASNLTNQVRNIADVTTAVAKGDLSRKITVDVKGEILALKITINTMVDQLGSFSSEVTRVAREVGTEGKLGGQAQVKGVAGTWKDLTDNVNSMAANLTNQVRNIADVTTAVAKGDLSKKITVNVKGEILALKDTINTMVDQLGSFASEVTRVAREVGTEGKLGGQAQVKGVAGTWKDLTDNVNSMASNLTNQVRNIADVTTAVAKGDLSRKITVDVKGEILALKNTINTMVDQLSSFASEVTRVAREVGSEGKLGGQAVVKGVGGTWKDLTDNVNSMAANLTNQVRNIADVTTAVAKGDLSKKITVNVKGEILALKNTINTMVDQLGSFASEVTRVAREVGTEGKLGGQAQVKGVAGTWKDLTDNVNSMAANLTTQVRNIADVTTAVAKGDLSRKITVDVKGEILALKNTINTMVDQLGSFASEVTRVAREVGTEGKLGGQAVVKGVGGTWKDLTDNVNSMAANLTNQVRNIADVTTAVAKGDLSKKITVDVKGEILALKNTINTMVDQLGSFASEVTRVAREVGTEGKLGGQAQVKGVAGTWKDLTDNVNSMAANLTNQVRNIAQVTTAVAKGDLSRKITVDVRGEIAQLKDTINTMVDQLNSFAAEVTRVAREVGTEGKLGGQAYVKGVGGAWKDLTDNVNSMAANLTNQVRNIAQVTTAIARGDLSRKITVDVRGEILELKNTINTLVDQLNSFASEVTRVAREVGTEGKLGGQAVVKGVAGTWKDLTDNVNYMAANLTTQVRGIAKVVTSVANGNLRRKLVLEAKGEIAELAETINSMIDTLALFAEQVTSVAREVGIEGKLGGQAKVPGAAGIWRDLTGNVNQLAANLTTQVRAIADVSTAVTKGDLTRRISVEASGEVAALKDNINTMITNLKETTRLNTDQDWLKTNLAKFTRMMQGQRDLQTVSSLILSELAPLVEANYGAFYVAEAEDHRLRLKRLASFGYKRQKNVPDSFLKGEGLVGQCASEKKRILLNNVPKSYLRINSGLGEAVPATIAILPVLFEGQIKAVVELASFNRYSEVHLTLLDQLTESIGIVLNTIAATMRTEELLKQSQALTEELKSQQEKLRDTNEELEKKAGLLTQQKTEVEQKNREVELAKGALEEKAAQLALTSKYKSQFLANMSHELRTPLNSMLILSQMLYENHEKTLSEKQCEYAKTIHSSGTDLLTLISDILDLSKIESGSVTVEIGSVAVDGIREFVERNFQHVAAARGLEFRIEAGPELPVAVQTDAKRLQQILKNLLSNAFKFTDKGSVSLSISKALEGWSPDHKILNDAKGVLAFSVRDTGIGIPKEKHQIVFEAFQQADASTSRKYGGTGLGLSISRELAALLGGQIRLESKPGGGSTFTLYLPITYVVPAGRPERAIPAQPAAFDAPQTAAPAEEPGVVDDRGALRHGQTRLLIIENDVRFARILLDMAHERGFKGLVAARVEEALELARRFKPSAITLDLRLEDAAGWEALDLIKKDPATKQIPVQIISGGDNLELGLERGAYAFLKKPVSRQDLERALAGLSRVGSRRLQKLLVVEGDRQKRHSLARLALGTGFEVAQASTPQEALGALRKTRYDCMVLDLDLKEVEGFGLIERIRRGLDPKDLPVLVYTGRELAPEAAASEPLSPEDEALLAGKKVLVVDDDIRNIFSLTAALERRNMQVLNAESGQQAIDQLAKEPGVDIVLMDIMMPKMDGYETMRAIRGVEKFRDLPILALTAKAMKGDREKCLEAGATDYIAKPVDIGQLLCMLRLWLKK